MLFLGCLFFSEKKSGSGLEGILGADGELKGAGEGETVVVVCCMREECIFNKSKKIKVLLK